MAETLECGHCGQRVGWRDYTEHVKICIRARIETWDAEEFSKKYYAQVRAQSRFRQPGDPRRRSQFKSWGWWLKDTPLTYGESGMTRADEDHVL
jgi:hypothetical protein